MSDDTLGQTLRYPYSIWLPSSGEEPRDFPLYLQRVRFFPDVPEHEAVNDVSFHCETADGIPLARGWSSGEDRGVQLSLAFAKPRLIATLLVALPPCGCDPGAEAGAGEERAPLAELMRGVNLAGGEFGEQNLPGSYDVDYTYPTRAEIDYFMGKGMNVFRVPFRWERLQPSLSSELDATEQARIADLVTYATGRGAFVVLDPHNYARYHDELIGVGPSVEDFAGFWSRLASLFREDPRVVFGLMNEPHDIGAAEWIAVANQAIESIRSAGATNLILVPGTNWTGAGSWSQDFGFGVNAEAVTAVADPGDNLAIEVHLYFDGNASGTSGACVSATVGSERLEGFASWLGEHGLRGFLGEFAVSPDETCLAALDDLLARVEAEADLWVGFTYWAGGPWWGDYQFSIEPQNGVDRPQMAVIEKYLP